MSDKLKKAQADLSNAIHAASVGIFERLEGEGRIIGNGHHAAQKVAKFAEDELESRWRKGEPVPDIDRLAPDIDRPNRFRM